MKRLNKMKTMNDGNRDRPKKETRKPKKDTKPKK